MSNKSYYFAVAFLETIFRSRVDAYGYGLRPPNPVANNRWFALHTGAPDPQVNNNQAYLECSYTGYARVALDVTLANTDTQDNETNVVTLAVDKVFPACTAAPQVATHWSLGVNSTGASELMYHGALPFPMNIQVGVSPTIKSGSTLTET